MVVIKSCLQVALLCFAVVATSASGETHQRTDVRAIIYLT